MVVVVVEVEVVEVKVVVNEVVVEVADTGASDVTTKAEAAWDDTKLAERGDLGGDFA